MFTGKSLPLSLGPTGNRVILGSDDFTIFIRAYDTNYGEKATFMQMKAPHFPRNLISPLQLMQK